MSGLGRALTSVIVAGALGIAAAAQQAPPDRSKAPAAGPAPALHVPAIEKRTPANAPEIWVVPMHKVPTVHLRWINPIAGGNPAGSPPGLASLVADMLDEGAGTRSALEIADTIDYLGAQLTTDASWDAASVDLHVPVARLAEALPVMVDVIQRPTFPADELDRMKKERLASLLEAQDDPEELVRFAFPRIVYGRSHQYGTSMLGTRAAIQGFTVEDLRRFHQARYLPVARTVIVVAGDVTADTVVPMIEKAFGTSTAAFDGGQPGEAAPKPGTRRVYLVDKPGAAQSQIRIGWIGVPRATPDYFPIRVLNTILGGSFTSRLNNNLREVHGYAYGAGSAFEMRRGAGPFYAAAGVQTDKTVDALKEFFTELTRIHEPVPADELEKAKRYLALQLLREFETTRDVAASVSQLFVYGLPGDFYQTYGDRVAAVTAEDVKRAADKYIQPGTLAVVIVGDRKAIEAGVRALNLGPLTVIEAGDIFK